jgi:molybdopterin molybdotransferase
MIPANQAEALILQQVRSLSSIASIEQVDLLSAAGRILAETIAGKLDIPHWDNSAMDGYAVRYHDVQTASSTQPVSLAIIESIPAGVAPQQRVEPGQAARIFTGSMMPAGADTIVIQEETTRQTTPEGDRVTVLNAPQPQAFVRHRAAFYQAGQPLLQPGIRLSAADIALLATVQCQSVPVFRRPRVAVLSTGNELVTPDAPLPQPGQIVDSNQYAIATLLTQAGAEPILLGIVPDDPNALRKAIAQALDQADMVISSGGVSVGDYDYVDQILTELGGEIQIRAIAVKPGKPLTFATFANRELANRELANRELANRETAPLYFGLPGNPVSALVTFWRFVLPALRKLSGLATGWSPLIVKGRSRHDLRSDGNRETYLWGNVEVVEGEYQFQLAGGSHSSGNLINLSQTNGLAILPVGETAIAAGDWVKIMLT